MQFGENDYTEFFINNNGMITFEQGIGNFTPNGLSAGVRPGAAYVPAMDRPALVEGEFHAATDMVMLIGNAELAAQAPANWLV